MWLAWEGAHTSRTMPSHGTTLVAFTRAFAAAFLEHLNQTKEVHHLDLMLLEWLKTEDHQVQHRACFLYPACGSYLTHVSGCESGLGVRRVRTEMEPKGPKWNQTYRNGSGREAFF